MTEDRTPEMMALADWWKERLHPNTPVSGAAVAHLAGMEPSRIHTICHNNRTVPGIPIIVRLTRALHELLAQCNHPLAASTSAPKALWVAGIISEQDLADEHPGNWLNLDGLSAQAQAALMAFYDYLRARSE